MASAGTSPSANNLKSDQPILLNMDDRLYKWEDNIKTNPKEINNNKNTLQILGYPPPNKKFHRNLLSRSRDET
jgi:hypothetical protein